MVYKPDIPKATDRLDTASQVDLLNNFAAIKTLFDVNHVTFDDANQGKHKFVTFPVRITDPTTEDSDCSLWVKDVVVHDTPIHTITRPELFIQKDSDGTPLAITGGQNILDGTQNSGWTQLSSGMVLKWVGNAYFTGPGATGKIVLTSGVLGPDFISVRAMYLTIRLPGVAENKWVQVKNFDETTQTLNFFCGPRYGNPATISDFYVDCILIGTV
jgi:hypothetical protein